mmetsp:Transcript_6716/g.11956  ORF Transcript_6716/g.11956 Transcript_6716/m.11956 type:complete len:715 (-) Transcript_6716:1355-3499(-)
MFILLLVLTAASSKLILMSDVTGSLTAIDSTGTVHWSLDTGMPFVSSYYSEDALEGTEVVYFPTNEGELVTFENKQFKLGSMTIAQFVDACPLISDTGLYFVGEKKTRGYSIEVNTGRVVAYYADLKAQVLETSSDQVMFIALVDYHVQALRVDDMKIHWNITYTQVKPAPSDSVMSYDTVDVRKAIESSGLTGQLVRSDTSESGALVPQNAYAKTRGRIKSIDNFALYVELLPDNYVLEADSKIFPLTIDRSLLAIEGKTEEAIDGMDLRSVVILLAITYLAWSLRPKSVSKPPIVQKVMSDMQVGTESAPSSPVKPEPKLPKNWKVVGQLSIFTDKVLGTGSNGTTVFEGTWQERPVAVKRILKQLSHFARKEMKLLLKTDSHPAVVSFYAWEEDDTFVYLAMEKCVGNLSLIVDLSNPKKSRSVQMKLASAPNKFALLEQAAQGIAYLHSMNIVHRDIKPMNILIDQFNNAKIADMASGKTLKANQSFGTHGHGSFGWQPAEVLRKSRRTLAVDVFSLGCTFYYTLCDGKHPFGQRMQRDTNILAGRYDLSGLSPLAYHLVSKMIALESVDRPTIHQVINHPLFWPAEKKLTFMQDLSDWLEVHEEMDPAYEAACSSVITGPWRSYLDPELAENIEKYRKYNSTSAKDLLRVIRNKRHHYNELPPEIKKLFGSVPEGYCQYFETKFPVLLPACIDFVATLTGEPLYAQYFS